MRIIALMCARMILTRFLAILIGVTLFVLTLEVVSYSKEILALELGGPWVMLKYILFRAPATASTFLPLSFLLALLLSLTELSYRNELVAIWASGISPAGLIAALAPLALGIGILHLVVSDRAIPAAAPTLRLWGIADYGEKQLKLGEKDPIWMRSGRDILRVTEANADSTELKGVILFERDEEGLLLTQTNAQSAKLENGVWRMQDAVRIQDGIQLTKLPEFVYHGSIKPATSGARSGDPEEMTLGQLGYFIENSGFGIRPVHVYQTWWHKRLTPLLSSLVMLAICVPLAARFRRGGGLGILFAAGVGLGFLYFILDGMLASAGELGFVTPWLAAWAPVMGFALLGTGLVLRGERT